MPEKREHQRSHLILQKTSEPKAYKAHPAKGGAKLVVPNLPRQAHGAALQAQLQALRPVADSAKE